MHSFLSRATRQLVGDICRPNDHDEVARVFPTARSWSPTRCDPLRETTKESGGIGRKAVLVGVIKATLVVFRPIASDNTNGRVGADWGHSTRSMVKKWYSIGSPTKRNTNERSNERSVGILVWRDIYIFLTKPSKGTVLSYVYHIIPR